MELQTKMLALISRFETCSLDAIYAQFLASHSQRDIMGALQSLKQAGKIKIVSPRKYSAL